MQNWKYAICTLGIQDTDHERVPNDTIAQTTHYPETIPDQPVLAGMIHSNTHIAV
jgi:hypothetical protein